MPLSLPQLCRLNNTLGLVSGAGLNAALLSLIWHCTPKEMHVYSVVLLQTCVIDLCFLVVYYACMPINVAGIGKMQYMVQAGWFESAPVWVNFTLCSAVITVFLISYVSIGTQFLYRYLVLVRSKHFSHKEYALMLTSGIGICLPSPILCYFSSYPTPSGMATGVQDVRPFLDRHTARDVAVEFINDTLGIGTVGGRDDVLFLLYTAYFVLIVSGVYALIVWTSAKCYFFAREAQQNRIRASI